MWIVTDQTTILDKHRTKADEGKGGAGMKIEEISVAKWNTNHNNRKDFLALGGCSEGISRVWEAAGSESITAAPDSEDLRRKENAGREEGMEEEESLREEDEVKRGKLKESWRELEGEIGVDEGRFCLVESRQWVEKLAQRERVRDAIIETSWRFSLCSYFDFFLF